MTTKEEIQQMYNELVGIQEIWNANNIDERVDPAKTYYTVSHRLLGKLLISMEVWEEKAVRERGPPPEG